MRTAAHRRTTASCVSYRASGMQRSRRYALTADHGTELLLLAGCRACVERERHHRGIADTQNNAHEWTTSPGFGAPQTGLGSNAQCDRRARNIPSLRYYRAHPRANGECSCSAALPRRLRLLTVYNILLLSSSGAQTLENIFYVLAISDHNNCKCLKSCSIINTKTRFSIVTD